jgi:hypothetical protein
MRFDFEKYRKELVGETRVIGKIRLPNEGVLERIYFYSTYTFDKYVRTLPVDINYPLIRREKQNHWATSLTICADFGWNGKIIRIYSYNENIVPFWGDYCTSSHFLNRKNNFLLSVDMETLADINIRNMTKQLVKESDRKQKIIFDPSYRFIYFKIPVCIKEFNIHFYGYGGGRSGLRSYDGFEVFILENDTYDRYICE